MRKLLVLILFIVTSVTVMGQIQNQQPITYTDYENQVQVKSIENVFNSYIIWIHEFNKQTEEVVTVAHLDFYDVNTFAIDETVYYTRNKYCVYRLEVIGINTENWYMYKLDKWLK